MPIRLKARMISTCPQPEPTRNRKYTKMTAAVNAHSSSRNLPCSFR